MGNYNKSNITPSEFQTLQAWKVPYTGFIKGVGYTYPENFPIEVPRNFSSTNPAWEDWVCQSFSYQVIDSSPEAVFRSMNYTEEEIIEKIKTKNNDGIITFTLGNESITVPTDNYRTKITIDEYPEYAIKIGVENLITKKSLFKKISASSNEITNRENASEKKSSWLTGDFLAETAISLIDIGGDGVKGIMLDRGKYMPYNTRTITGKWTRMQKAGDITIRSRFWNFTTSAKALNSFRIGGKILGTAGTLISLGIAGHDLIENPNTKTVTSAATKCVIVGLAFIPVCGWAIALVAGIADSIYGDDFYEFVDDTVKYNF